MDSASEDEVSESDETGEELLAIGNDHDTSEDSDYEALATLQKNEASTCAPIRNIPGIEGALFSVTQRYPLPPLPSTSLEDSTFPEQNGGSPSSHQSGSLVLTGRSEGQRIPIQSKLFTLVCSVSKRFNANCFTKDCLCLLHQDSRSPLLVDILRHSQ